MKRIKNILKHIVIWLYLAPSLLSACTQPLAINTSPIPNKIVQDTLTPIASRTLSLTATVALLSTQTATPTLIATTDMWKIQKCPKVPSVIEKFVYDWWWLYNGDVVGHGEVDMLLNFTQSNEIYGFYFDIEKMREYQVTGCVEGRAFTIWLEQSNIVEAVIQGEFPEADPRGHFSSSDSLKVEVLIGSLIEKANSQNSPIYLSYISATAGTVEHRFRIAGVEDDAVILKASQQFLAAIATDDRTQVIQMIKFPLKIQKDGKTTLIQTSDSLRAEYDEVFDVGLKARLAKTFPNYLIASSGNFIGTIGLSVYGGGGIIFDDHGKVIAIYNWQKPVQVSTPTLTPNEIK